MIFAGKVLCFAVLSSSFGTSSADLVPTLFFGYSNEKCPACYDLSLDHYPAGCPDNPHATRQCPEGTNCQSIWLKKRREISGSGGQKTRRSFSCWADDEISNWINRPGWPFYRNLRPFTGPGSPPPPTTTSPRAEPESLATCSPGEYPNGAAGCDKCAENTYSEEGERCVACPDGLTASIVGAVSRDDCTKISGGNDRVVLTAVLFCLAMISCLC